MASIRDLLRRANGDDELMTCQVTGDSHVGLVRAINEDSYFCANQPGAPAVLAAVADGMGGHEFGEIASYFVVKYLLAEWHAHDDQPFATVEEVRAFITRSLEKANNHIFHVNRVLRIRWAMGTTATLGVLWNHKLVIGHCGDSRCYRWRKGKLTQLTTDQTWREEMVQHGYLSAEEAATHPLANMLTNCVGALRNLRIEFRTTAVQEGDRYLFCSDGISSLVDEADIGELLGQYADATQGVKHLVHRSLQKGGHDNITAVCLYT
jgi:protein phosphatase